MPEIQREEAIGLAKDAPEVSAIQLSALKERLQRDSSKGFLELREHRELIEMRARWSSGILALLVLIVLSDIIFSWALGFHVISFSSDWSVPVFIGDGLIRTLGLAYIIVHFLFNKDSLRSNKTEIK